MAASTVRLPEHLEERLSSYCETTGATKNRALCIALAAFLDDGPVPRAALGPREPDVSRSPASASAP